MQPNYIFQSVFVIYIGFEFSKVFFLSQAQAEKYFSVVRPMEGTLISINASICIKSRVMQ
jgi:hypothetical protein